MLEYWTASSLQLMHEFGYLCVPVPCMIVSAKEPMCLGSSTFHMSRPSPVDSHPPLPMLDIWGPSYGSFTGRWPGHGGLQHCPKRLWMPQRVLITWRSTSALLGDRETPWWTRESKHSSQHVGKVSPFLLCWSSLGNCLLLVCTVLSRLQWFVGNGATADPSHVLAPYVHSYGISETDANWISNKRYYHNCYSGEWPILWKLTLPYIFAGAPTGLIGFGYDVAFLTEK